MSLSSEVERRFETESERKEENQGGRENRTTHLIYTSQVSDQPLISEIDVIYVDVTVKGEMRGITVVDGQLFIVESDDPVVKVYDSHTLNDRSHINIPGMKAPQDIAGCSHNKALYISDREFITKCIHRVNLTDNSVKGWKLRENYESYGLSVTSEHNVLVTVRVGDTGRVVEYTSEGQLIRDMELNTSIVKPMHTVKASSDQFVIYHEMARDKNLINVISLINSEGLIIKSNSRERGCIILGHSLAIDNNRGHVYAYSYKNDKETFLIFNRELSLIGQIQKSKEVHSWSKICFYTGSNRMFVVTSYTERRSLECVTVVDEIIYITYKGRSFIGVYNLHALSNQYAINITGMHNPQGLAGCSHNKALYISDWECIHRVNLTDNSVTSWSLKYDFCSCSLSVTKEHHLIVTMDAFYTSPSMREYTSEGHLIRDIELDSSIEDAWHTVQLSTDQFIICHGSDDSSLHRLCVISSEGQIIKSYGREGGGGEGQLNEPRSLAIDKSRGHILVADSANSRVLMFSRDLVLLGQVQTRDDLSELSCLYFDSSSDRLFIVEQRSDRVLIICSPDQWLKKI